MKVSQRPISENDKATCDNCGKLYDKTSTHIEKAAWFGRGRGGAFGFCYNCVLAEPGVLRAYRSRLYEAEAWTMRERKALSILKRVTKPYTATRESVSYVAAFEMYKRDNPVAVEMVEEDLNRTLDVEDWRVYFSRTTVAGSREVPQAELAAARGPALCR